MAGVIELVNYDLDWIGVAHDDDVLDTPVLLPPLRNQQGTVLIDAPHTLAIGPGVALVHRGEEHRTVRTPCAVEVARWAALTFFATPQLVGTRHMDLDALVRWVNDVPVPTKAPCAKCGGTTLDPSDERHPDDPTMVLACKACDGHGFTITNFEAGFDHIGPVTFDRRALRCILPHLRGATVGLAFAPSTDHPGRYDAHIRHLRIAGDQGSWGDWRIMLSDLA